jgi:hypothetical protein
LDNKVFKRTKTLNGKDYVLQKRRERRATTKIEKREK